MEDFYLVVLDFFDQLAALAPSVCINTLSQNLIYHEAVNIGNRNNRSKDRKAGDRSMFDVRISAGLWLLRNHWPHWSLIKLNCSPVCCDRAWQTAWVQIYTCTPTSPPSDEYKRDCCQQGLNMRVNAKATIISWLLYSWKALRGDKLVKTHIISLRSFKP